MKEYIYSVTAVAIMAALSDILIPKNWQKYISILTGAIILVTLTSPLLKIKGLDNIDLSFPESEYRQYSIEDEIASKLKTEIEKDISKRLESEFNLICSADVTLEINDGRIMAVEKIYLNAKENEAVAARLEEIYGCRNIIWRRN